MAQTVNIPVSFYDAGNSIAKLGNQLASYASGKGFSKDFLIDIKAAQSEAQKFQDKVLSIPKGKPINFGLLQGILSEGEQVKIRLETILKEAQASFKSVRLTEQQEIDLKEYQKQLDQTTSNLERLKQEESNMGKTETFTTAGTGFGNAKKYEVLLSNTKQYYQNLAALKLDSGKSDDDMEKYKTELAKKGAVDRLKIELDAATELRKIHSDDIDAQKVLQTSLRDKIQEITNKGSQQGEEDRLRLIQLKAQYEAVSESINKFGIEVQKSGKQLTVLGSLQNSLSSSIAQMVMRYFSLHMVMMQARRVVRESIDAIKQLDKSFTEIAMVTTYTNKEVWGMRDSFLALAHSTGLTITEISKLSVEFFRQGRSLSETLKLTEAAGIAAKLAGISGSDSVQYLTSAINGYRLSADQAIIVSDKFAAVAASSATDYEELAIALTKVAAQAYSAGVNMDNMMGFIAKALEVTREAPENIGTAFKTIFARMSEIKDYGKTLEDGMDINRVDKALNIVNVSLRNQKGEIRNLDEVLIDVGYKWKDLTKNQKAYIATALAGTRQQTRLLAVFEDFDRTMQLTKVSANSLGATYAQQQKYYSSIEYAITELQTSWQNFITSVISSKAIIAITEFLTGIVKIIDIVLGNDFGAAIASMIALGLAVVTVAESWKKFIELDTVKALLDKFTLGTVKSTAALVSEVEALAMRDTYIKLLNSGNATQAAALELLAKKKGIDVTATQAQTAAEEKEVTVKALQILLSNLWVVALVAVAAAIGYVVYQSWKANGSLENLNKTTREFAAANYNSKKKINDLNNLKDQYDALNKKIVKTAEDEQKLLELGRQMQDIVGKDYNILDINGKVDTNALIKALDDTQKEVEKSIQDGYKNIIEGLNRHTYAYQDMDAASKSIANLGKAMDLVGDSIGNTKKITVADFEAMTAAEQDYWLSRAEMENYAAYGNKTIITADNYKGTVNEGTTNFNAGAENAGYIQSYSATMVVTPVIDQAKLDEVNEKVTQSTYAAWNVADSMTKADMYKSITAGMSEEQKDVVNHMLEGGAAIQQITEQFGNRAHEILYNIGDDLDALNRTMEVIGDFNLTPEQQKMLTGDILSTGPIETFNKDVDKLNLGFEESLKLATALNELEFNNLNTGDTLTGLKSMEEGIQKVMDIYSQNADFDIDYLKEMATTYPEIADDIIKNGELTVQGKKDAMEAENARAINELENQNIYYENQITLLQAQYDAYASFIGEEDYLKEMSMEEAVRLDSSSLDTQLANYYAYLTAKGKMDGDYQNAKAMAEEAFANNEYETYDDAWAAALDHYKLKVDASSIVLKSSIDLGGDPIDTAAKYYENRRKEIEDQINSYKAMIKINNTAIDGIKNGTLFTKEETAATEAYAAKLNEIYILQQQLAVLENELSQFQFEEEHAKSGEEWLTSIYSQNAALEAQNKTLVDLSKAQKSAQDAIIAQTSSMSKAYKIVNGRMIPVMSEYNKLSDTEKEALDNATESYNSYTQSIDENTNKIDENTAAMEENLQKIEEKTVELYDKLAEAIKNSEQKKFELLKKGFDEESKLLDKRRQMYEDAYASEDYLSNLQDQTDERVSIIEELAQLEGATDLASAARRKELLDQLTSVNKTYNKTVTDFNREALLKSIDDEKTALEEKQTAYEEAYQKRIEDTEWLESEITRIMNEGLDYTIQYLKDNSPEYQDAWSITKDNIEDEWINLYDIVNTAVEDIANNIPDFSGMLEELRQAAAYVQTINSGNPAPPPGGTVKQWHYRGTPTGSGTAGKAAAEKARRDAINAATKSFEKLGIPASQLSIWPEYRNAYDGKIEEYARGGIASFTGPAWLDGTKSRPERILSPVQTELFDNMIKNLEALNTSSTSNINDSISIGNITISTPQLNTNADFSTAGKSLAAELRAAINERGLNINKKK